MSHSDLVALDILGTLLAASDDLDEVGLGTVEADVLETRVRSSEFRPFRADPDVLGAAIAGVIALRDEGPQPITNLLDEVRAHLTGLCTADLDSPRRALLATALLRRLPSSTIHALETAVLDVLSTAAAEGMASDVPLADVHVHQGAALPVEMLIWRNLRSRTIPRWQAAAPPISDLNDRSVRVEPVMWLLRAAVEGHPDIRTAARVAKAAAVLGPSDPRVEPAEWAALRDLANRWQPAEDDGLEVDPVATKRAALASWPHSRLMALLRAEMVMVGALLQRRSGLELFVELFDRSGVIRKSGRYGPDRAQYFRDAIVHLVERAPRLGAVDLRFGELAMQGRTADIGRVLERSYQSAIDGYLAAAQEMGSSCPRVSLPLGLIKTRAVRREPFAFDVGGIYELCAAAVDLALRWRSLGPIIDGLDVCGVERAAPSWLFVPALRMARARANDSELELRWPIRYHAGEDPWSVLNGLRSIDEFTVGLRPDTPAASGALRLGHGLSLTSTGAEVMAEQRPAMVVLEDLTWVLTLHDDERVSLDGATLLAVRVAVVALAKELLRGTRADWSTTSDTVIATYRSLTKVDDLVRVGFLVAKKDRLGMLYEAGHDAIPSLLARWLGASRTALLGSLDETVRTLAMEALASVHGVLGAVRDAVTKVIRTGPAVVEVCPTSNLLIADLGGFADHPVTELVHMELPFVVGSDDPGVFGVAIDEEWSRLAASGVVPQPAMASARQLSNAICATHVSSSVTRLARVAAHG